MSNLAISSDRPTEAKVTLDGRDISKALRGIRIDVEYGEPIAAHLELVVYQFHAPNLDGATVQIPEATRELLIQLGWTPPAAEHVDQAVGVEDEITVVKAIGGSTGDFWVWRCPGNDVCDGWVGLELPSPKAAIEDAERHIREKHR